MSLIQKLKGKRPLGVYFESWSSSFATNANSMDLANIKQPINLVFLAFAIPACTYLKNSMSFIGSGLNFTSNFLVVKQAISILKSNGIIVMLSVGGASYQFDIFNSTNIVDLATDLGVDGIDIDWEPTSGAAKSNELGGIISIVSSQKCDFIFFSQLKQNLIGPFFIFLLVAH